MDKMVNCSISVNDTYDGLNDAESLTNVLFSLLFIYENIQNRLYYLTGRRKNEDCWLYETYDILAEANPKFLYNLMMAIFTVINTNTKVRRLGYLRQIINMIGNETLPEAHILYELTRWAELHADALERYVDSTGIIRRSPKMTPAKRYLDFTIGAQLIVKLGGEFRLSNFGKIFYVVSSTKCGINPFDLSDIEISFLLNWLLRIDADFIVPIIQIIWNKKETTLACVQGEFQEFVLHWLNMKEDNHSKELSERIAIKAARNRILNWRNPKKYIEHVVPPRTNWLLDLKLLDWDTYRIRKKLKLSSSGSNIMSVLPVFGGKFKYVTDSWLNNDYFKNLITISSNSSSARLFSSLTRKEQTKNVVSSLEKTFDLFDTSGLGKVVASQFLFYTCLSMAINKKILCGFNEIKDRLSEVTSKYSNKYYFYWSAMDREGHITKRHKGGNYAN